MLVECVWYKQVGQPVSCWNERIQSVMWMVFSSELNRYAVSLLACVVFLRIGGIFFFFNMKLIEVEI